MPTSFLSLPGEIRNRIYTFALTTDLPITDANSLATAPPKPSPASTPTEEKSDPMLAARTPLPQTPHHSIPALGTALLRTCALIHAEAPVSLLYARNTFRFTSVTHCQTFLLSLPPWLRARVHDVEVDVRDISPSPLPAPEDPRAHINREWPQYMSWRPTSTAQLGSLRVDAPGLRVLRLDFSAWPRARLSRRHLWDILRRLLHNVEGLERVVLKGCYAAGTAMERREPWDPAYYVGTDEVTTEGVVDRMWGTVRGSAVKDGKSVETMGDDGKVVRWERDGEGNIALEVVSLTHLTKKMRGAGAMHHNADKKLELAVRQRPSDPWPANGACTYEQYSRRKDPLWFASSSRSLNPNFYV
ncbi:hypothetical protein SLS55_003276 [Diplodia seriata]|uniref:DUF7730 domain-containing protein n=1 Tax=Diplodia seriata TaxID=420778 RepID=A0A0G2GEK8_9PEZI|nr:hypothetical protein UCDDS831_g03899 [Diplodia seriata]